MRGFTLGLAIVASTATLYAQIGYPGQYPGGSPYPGGNPYPGGGRRNPNPNGGNPVGGGRDSGRSNRGKKDAPPTVTTTGMLRLVSGSQFVLEADDHRIITYSTGANTKVQKDGKDTDLKALAIGDHFTVDATSDTDGYFTATTVTFNLVGTSADRRDAARTWDLPTLTERKASASAASTSSSNASGSVRGDDDRPVLRRASKGGDDADADKAASTPAPAGGASATGNTAATTENGPPQTASSQPSPEEIAADQAANRPKTELHPDDPALDADDPGKPALRAGRPAPRPRAASSDDDTTTVATVTAGAPSVGLGPAGASAAPASANQAPAQPRSADESPSIIRIEEDPVIVKAREAVEEYAGALPDFFCRQVTTRYAADSPKSGWDALDTITADLSYKEGHEDYQNIKVGNKSVSNMNDVPGGASTTGEFSSIVQDLFDPYTAAVFRKGGQDTLRGHASQTFKFEVKRENSHWRLVAAGQLYYPAFRGTVWVEKGTSRVLRIEMESRNVPVLFPFDKTETAVDYDFIRLSTPQEYVMPVTAEVLSCEQGSSRCLRNRIEFRNYRKFGAESDITFSN